MDYYEILGVQKNADASIIKKQYHKLAKEYHPDKTKGDIHKQDKFIEIQTAYATLSDRDKRYVYDMTGGEDEIFENIASFFSFTTPQHDLHARAKPDSIKDVQISLDEYCNGVEKEFEIDEIIKCSSCDETGVHDYKNNIRSCTACNSLGFDMNIPLFACGMCNGRGFTIVNNVKCSLCKGVGNIEKHTIKRVSIPEKPKKDCVILTTDKTTKCKITFNFSNRIDEEGNVIILKEISIIKWLCGYIHQVDLYPGKTSYIKTEGAFDLSDSWTVEKNIKLQFQLIMNSNVIRILRKCRSIFMKIFKCKYIDEENINKDFHIFTI